MFYFAIPSSRATRRRRWVATFYFVVAAMLFIAGTQSQGALSTRSTVATCGFALVYVGLGVGVEQAREWARRVGGALCGLFAALNLTLELCALLSHAWRLEMFVIVAMSAALFFIPWLGVAVYSFMPSTRAHFAEVRNAKDRTSALTS